ncbi:MAG: 2-C-methyl-D-erythritol 4-phosphate cytidylyltransferase [Faecalibacterium prausnitzii]
MEKTVSAVLVAAGSSTRMGFDKLSFDLGGETVLHRSIRAFAQCPQITELVLVAGKNREFVAQQAADCPKPVQIVAGGATRAESAKNGVLAAHGELVAVHDAARPFVSAVGHYSGAGSCRPVRRSSPGGAGEGYHQGRCSGRWQNRAPGLRGARYP